MREFTVKVRDCWDYDNFVIWHHYYNVGFVSGHGSDDTFTDFRFVANMKRGDIRIGIYVHKCVFDKFMDRRAAKDIAVSFFDHIATNGIGNE